MHFIPWHYIEVSSQLHTSAALLLGREPCTHRIGGWVGPRAGLDMVAEKRSVP